MKLKTSKMMSPSCKLELNQRSTNLEQLGELKGYAMGSFVGGSAILRTSYLLGYPAYFYGKAFFDN